MARNETYTCTRCSDTVPRSKIMVKKVLFTTPGESHTTHRSRVVDRLCPKCVAGDDHWNHPGLRRPDARVVPVSG